MTYKANSAVSAAAISDLRGSVGWNGMEQCYKDPSMTSYYHIAAYDDDLLVGFIDCVSNGVTDAYIQDLVVRPSHQHRGIGTELMNMMLAYLGQNRIFMISVIYDESLKGFYDRFGFHGMLAGQLQTFESV